MSSLVNAQHLRWYALCVTCGQRLLLSYGVGNCDLFYTWLQLEMMLARIYNTLFAEGVSFCPPVLFCIVFFYNGSVGHLQRKTQVPEVDSHI